LKFSIQRQWKVSCAGADAGLGGESASKFSRICRNHQSACG
jgi:hypothetical protein